MVNQKFHTLQKAQIERMQFEPKFTILKETPIGRLGRIKCAHGYVETPAFIFCATKGAIKGASVDTMLRAGTQAILANTYNLMDFPGGDFVANHGGLHRMMEWNGPMWTDSGGFQVFSLGHGSVSNEIKGKRQSTGFKVSIDEEGIIFQSPRDGVMRRLTPETSMYIQQQIGADFIFALDECTAMHIDKVEVEERMRRSHRWEERSLKEHLKNPNGQGLYGIVQGGVYEDLRQESIDFVNSKPFFGYGIGGSLGTLREDMIKVLDICCNGHTGAGLHKAKPKHLLGIGKMQNIEDALPFGIDTFDCVHPTRLARHGGALVSKQYHMQKGFKEHISLKNAQYKYDYTPIDDQCNCNTCQRYSRAYIKYLLDAKEILGIILLVEHNVYIMNQFMNVLRQKIQDY